jgi:hypothetical protein
MRMVRVLRSYIAVTLGIFLAGSCFWIGLSARTIEERIDLHQYPKLANYYLFSPLSEPQVKELAKWDVVVVSIQTIDNSQSMLKRLRELNPSIVILVYVPSQEFPDTYYKEWEKNTNGVWHRLLRGITDDMYLRGVDGKYVYFWEQNRMLNMKSAWVEYLSSFVSSELLASDMYDGIFFDNTFTDVSWVNGGNIDLNRDGKKDSKEYIQAEWQKGMASLISKTRSKTKRDIIVIGNGTEGYYDSLNGLYFESVDNGLVAQWGNNMSKYRLSVRTHESPSVAIIGNNTNNTRKQNDYQRMRFGLGSALLEDGYYSFDVGTWDHSQLWWYDEYDVELGTPLGDSVPIGTNASRYAAALWRRDFTNGTVVVNSKPTPQTISLGGDYEKIHGTQDNSVNDGSIISELSLSAHDGIMLLKSLETLRGVLFHNGDFVRFFRADGSRVRNGFFTNDTASRGGAQVAKIDIDGNGRDETISIYRGRVTVRRDNGRMLMRVRPYGALYKESISVSFGDMNADGKKEVVVAPKNGKKLPIKIFSYTGAQMGEDWYPLGAQYSGGYSVAMVPAVGTRAATILVGSHPGVVTQYDFTKKKIGTSWSVFTTGVPSVAVGNVRGSSDMEVVVGSPVGVSVSVRIYDLQGKQIEKAFVPFATLGTPGIDVQTQDVDFDGVDDILVFSRGL